MFQSKTIAAMEVQRQRRFWTQVEAATTAAAQIRALIDKISRSVQSLNNDIETEEERTRCWDRRNPAYSILARGLTTQRNNLAETVTTLQKRLADAEALANTPIGSETKLLQPA
jgi:chromosome segregation ATPase